MARKRTPEPEAPRPYAEIVVYRPNGVEYSRTPTGILEARNAVGEMWGRITNQNGWMPEIRVIRTADGEDITRYI